jgi:hypothetical protein
MDKFEIGTNSKFEQISNFKQIHNRLKNWTNLKFEQNLILFKKLNKFKIWTKIQNLNKN